MGMEREMFMAAAILFRTTLSWANILIATLKRNHKVVEIEIHNKLNPTQPPFGEFWNVIVRLNLIMIMSFALENHTTDSGNEQKQLPFLPFSPLRGVSICGLLCCET